VAGEDRLELAAQLADAALELCAVAGLVDLPRLEPLIADAQTGLAEFLLRREPFGVRGEVALQL
jgi:hypothetical protein